MRLVQRLPHALVFIAVSVVVAGVWLVGALLLLPMDEEYAALIRLVLAAALFVGPLVVCLPPALISLAWWPRGETMRRGRQYVATACLAASSVIVCNASMAAALAGGSNALVAIALAASFVWSLLSTWWVGADPRTRQWLMAPGVDEESFRA